MFFFCCAPHLSFGFWLTCVRLILYFFASRVCVSCKQYLQWQDNVSAKVWCKFCGKKFSPDLNEREECRRHFGHLELRIGPALLATFQGQKSHKDALEVWASGKFEVTDIDLSHVVCKTCKTAVKSGTCNEGCKSGLKELVYGGRRGDIVNNKAVFAVSSSDFVWSCCNAHGIFGGGDFPCNHEEDKEGRAMFFRK